MNLRGVICILFSWGCAAALSAADVATPVVILGDAVADTSRSILIDASVVRFVSKPNQKQTGQKIQGRTIQEVLETLRATGDAEELYRGVGCLTGWPLQNVTFKGVEHRPAFRFSAQGEPVQYSSFGLNLNVGASPSPSGGLALAWQGNYSWSTNFIPRNVFETLMMGVMIAGKTVGAGFVEEDTSESVGLRRASGVKEGGGLLDKFFQPKKVKAKEIAPPEPKPGTQSYLDALRQDRVIFGQRELQPHQLAIIPINPDSAASFERFYLAIRYEWQ